MATEPRHSEVSDSRRFSYSSRANIIIVQTKYSGKGKGISVVYMNREMGENFQEHDLNRSINL